MKKYNVRLLDKYDDLNHFKLFKKEVKKLKATRKEKKALLEFGDFNDNPFGFYQDNGSPMSFLDAIRIYDEVKQMFLSSKDDELTTDLNLDEDLPF